MAQTGPLPAHESAELAPSYIYSLPYYQDTSYAPDKQMLSTLEETGSRNSEDGVQSYASAIAACSENASNAIFSTWSSPDAAIVYNLDMELDDHQRLNHVISTWLSLDSQPRGSLILVAGQRTGEVDTFKELVDQTAMLMSIPSTEVKFDEDHGGRAMVGEVSVIRGAPLKGGGAMIESAASRIASALDGRKYLWHNNTSEALFAALPSDVQGNCLAHVCTCDTILAAKSPIVGANLRWDPEAYRATITACEDKNIPFISVHGSTLGFERQTLSELPDWSNVLHAPVAYPRAAQDQIRFTMQQVLQWTARIYGALSGEHGERVAGVVRNLTTATGGNATTSNTATEVQAETSLPKWAHKPSKAETYTYEDCTLKSAMKRAWAIPQNLGCPLNNTIGDYAASILDGPSVPTGVRFLPLSADFGDKQAGREANLTMKDPRSSWNPLMAVGGTEDDLLAIHASAQRRAAGRARSRYNDTTKTAIVDQQLAEERRHFSAVETALLEKIGSLASIEGSEEMGIRALVASALRQITDGAMSAACVGVERSK